MFLQKTIEECKSWMNVKLLGGREIKWCGMLEKEKKCL